MKSSWLAHPLTRGLDLDDPRTTALRLQILKEKRFLRKLYLEWYGDIAATLPTGAGGVLELGSGAGFLRDVVGDLRTKTSSASGTRNTSCTAGASRDESD